MAKKKKKSNTGNVTSTNVTNTFIKGMNKDLNASFVPKESWFHAINAYNNSADGDAGTLGNEPANLKCADVPYPIIGAIHKEGDLWYVYSTDDISSVASERRRRRAVAPTARPTADVSRRRGCRTLPAE